jgi:hypothetical protein
MFAHPAGDSGPSSHPLVSSSRLLNGARLLRPGRYPRLDFSSPGARFAASRSKHLATEKFGPQTGSLPPTWRTALPRPLDDELRSIPSSLSSLGVCHDTNPSLSAIDNGLRPACPLVLQEAILFGFRLIPLLLFCPPVDLSALGPFLVRIDAPRVVTSALARNDPPLLTKS